MPLFGPPNVEKMKAKRDIQALIAALSYQKDAGVRAAAATALGELKDGSAVQSLIAAANDSDRTVRLQVVTALGRFDDAEPARLETNALGDADPEVRAAASDALRAMGAAAVDSLIAALGSKQAQVHDASFGLLREMGSAAVDPLIAALKNENSGVRAGAAAELRLLRDKRAVEPLIDALEDKDGAVREHAAAGLGEFGDARAVEPLIRRLRPGIAEGGAIASALGNLGDARAVEPLFRHGVDEAYSGFGQNARDAIVRIGPGARQTLIAKLTSDRPRIETRLKAGELVDRIGWEPGDEDAHAYFHILKGQWDECIALGSAAVKPLIDLSGNCDVRQVVQALAQIGDSQAVPWLLTLLDKPDPELRSEVANLLAQLGWEPDKSAHAAQYWIVKGEWQRCAEIGADAVWPLVRALDDPWETVRREAAAALGKMGAHADAAVERLIESCASDPNDQVRHAAASAVRDINGYTPFLDGLKDPDEQKRKAAADALAKIGAPAVEPLIALLGDVNSNAASIPQILARIGDARAVEPLIAAATRGNLQAVLALGALGDQRAVEPLVALLKTNPNSVLASTLDKLGWHPGQDEAGAQYWIVKKQWDRVAPIVAAAAALAETKESRAGKPLALGLRSPDPETRKIAGRSLVKLGPLAAPDLVALLLDHTTELRKQALDILQQVGWQPTTPDHAARYQAARCEWSKCAAIGAAAVEPLIAALSWDEEAGCGAATALAQIGDPRGAQALIAALQDRRSGLRKAAVDALAQMGDDRSVAALIGALAPPRQGPFDFPTGYGFDDHVVAALARVGAPAAGPLVAALKNPNKDIRYGAAKALTLMKAGEVEPLVALLDDPDSTTRSQAVEILDKIGWKPGNVASGVPYWIVKDWKQCASIGVAAIEPLVALLDSSFYGDRAGWALAKIGVPAVAPLIRALGISRRAFMHAAEALGTIGDARAIEPLIAGLEGSWPGCNPDQTNEARLCAAKALVSLYRSGRIGERKRGLILAQKDTIKSTRSHADWVSSHQDQGDRPSPETCGDPNRHNDEGGGHFDKTSQVDFPL